MYHSVLPESDSIGNGTRKALVISVSNYDNLQKLDFCKNDGVSINRYLLLSNLTVLYYGRHLDS